MVFDNKLWVLGGDDNDTNNYNDVWYTEDGIDWTLVTNNAAWGPRSSFGLVEFENKMWVLGGYGDVSTDPYYKNDVWVSEDGAKWSEVSPSSDIWAGRSSAGVQVFGGMIWVIGGYYWNSTEGNILCKDVWYSTDGQNWVLENNNADWPGRFYSSSTVHDNKIWLSGGRSLGSMLSDVWYGALQ